MTALPETNNTATIWRRLGERVRRFIAARVRSAADVDDLVQSVFLRVHEKQESLRDADRLDAWVFQIARNSIADHFRRRTFATLEESLVDPVNLNDDSPNRNAEVAGWLPEMIEELPADQRRAAWLYEFEGVPQQEIADRESISLSGAKSRIQRGRRKLAAMLLECCRFQFDTLGNVLDCEPRRRRCSVESECCA